MYKTLYVFEVYISSIQKDVHSWIYSFLTWHQVVLIIWITFQSIQTIREEIKNRTQKETEMQELQASLSLKKGRYVLHITYYIYVLDTYYKLYCNNHIIKHDINYNNESNTSNSKTTTETIPIPTIPIQIPQHQL